MKERSRYDLLTRILLLVFLSSSLLLTAKNGRYHDLLAGIEVYTEDLAVESMSPQQMLYYGVLRSDFALVAEALVQGAEINSRELGGATTLSLACRKVVQPSNGAESFRGRC